jgi:2-polyprenyl-3-methyl-5-hydroxy-6-metoxy-1,4-benzoquinol methylase
MMHTFRYTPLARCVDWQNSLHKNEFLDHECDLTAEPPFSDAQFDTIILSDVLEHIPAPDKLWVEMARILAPGGKVLMNTPFFFWLHETPHGYYPLRQYAQSVNLDLVILEPIGGGALEVVTDILAKNRCFLPLEKSREP